MGARVNCPKKVLISLQNVGFLCGNRLTPGCFWFALTSWELAIILPPLRTSQFDRTRKSGSCPTTEGANLGQPS